MSSWSLAALTAQITSFTVFTAYPLTSVVTSPSFFLSSAGRPGATPAASRTATARGRIRQVMGHLLEDGAGTSIGRRRGRCKDVVGDGNGRPVFSRGAAAVVSQGWSERNP